MALSAHARGFTDRVATPLARGLVHLGATANALTATGLLLTFAGAVVVLAGDPVAGGIVLAFGTAVDALDGAVARLRGTTSRWGAFFDSVADRVGDAVLFGAVTWLVRDEPVLFALSILVLGASQITSYVRARAESLGWGATVGLVERPERVMIMITAITLGFVPVALYLLAVGSTVTVVQRVAAVRRQARAEGDHRGSPGAPGTPPQGGGR
ncbi:CDP-alcohol phosphatidyltransferase family protein [soil metagenome]